MDVAQSAEKRSQAYLEKPPSTHFARDIQKKSSTAQRSSAAHVQPLKLVLVVTDKDHGRATSELAIFGAEAHRQQRVSMNDNQQGGKERQPFATPLRLLLLALMHNTRVKPQAGIIQEIAAVDLADIDPRQSLLRDDVYG